MMKIRDLLKGQNLRKERRRNDAPQRNSVSRTRTARLCKPHDSSQIHSRHMRSQCEKLTTFIGNVSSIPTVGWYVNVHYSTDVTNHAGADAIVCGDVTK